MNRFNDVLPGSEYYDEIMEAYNTLLEDGEPLMKGIPYQVFEKDKPYVYTEIKAKKNQTTFEVNRKIKPESDNPLYVMVDGVTWGYKGTKIVGEKTEVYLYTPPKEGSIVSIMSYGKPLIQDDRPVTKTKPYYPHYKLKHYDQYVYWPYWGRYETVTILGRKLKRIEIDPADLAPGLSGVVPEFDQDLARKYIGSRTDVYIIPPSGRIHLPWNFEGMTGKVTYAYNTKGQNGPKTASNVKSATEEFKAYTGNATDTKYEPYRNDRFFPDSYITRSEMIIALNRLRKHFLARFTDNNAPTNVINQKIQAYSGQRVFRLNGTYPAGKGQIKVSKRLVKGDPDSNYVFLQKGVDYEEFDNHTILMKHPVEEGYYYGFYYERQVSERFYDLGRNTKVYNVDTNKLESVNGTTAEWVQHALELEGDRIANGQYVLSGSTPSSYYDNSATIPKVNKWHQPVGGGNSSNKRDFILPYIKVSRYHILGTLHKFKEWCLERLV